jgi:hypothetical protein
MVRDHILIAAPPAKHITVAADGTATGMRR